MRPPAFWAAGPDHPAARCLAPLGAAYGALVARRMDRPGARAGCPILCLGNFTLGGAGKTPAALALAALLAALGRTPAFLSRGYGGRTAGPVQVDLGRHDADAVGDEPLLLARRAPTVVSRDRPAGAALCRALGADTIVMDDGLQNPSLVKDLGLAVIDGPAGLGNGLPVPAGPLRAPLDRQWRHVAGLILVGDGPPGEAVARAAEARGLPVHRARLVRETDDLAGRRCLAFAGIGRPDKFFATLAAAGAVIAATRPFPDHHRYRAGELATLAAEAQRLGAELVTTEKDAARLPPNFAAQVRVLRVRLAFDDAGALRRQVQGALAGAP
ncbi:Tetraacyldisaccharide 4'-kinase [Methylobacterium tardum]|jgi:tetraacyldisaccharide 4'-kinase|uniref:Tetraacyldisaccharide 4'-kinase n=1 Tax=Methylobacterium tardum TaxID=374432 RepID=A0AA37WV55_9HYPH|nr:tetraacyldisaccharide 4'-kinase [Methylobacterium tardum]GJE49013.1 Tetraacyldisaccharide 4'-kinase [Methylobacterium tardum]GLS74156.1 tetraacyldisaccharide 4'-kinase [Methylobacterium tardum]